MERRLQDNPRHKRYFLSLLITFSLWFLVGLVVVFVDPESVADMFLTGGYIVLMVPLSLALWFSFSLLLGNSRYGILMTLGAIVSLYLRTIGIGSWWVLIPWWGLIICMLIFWMTKRKVDKSEAD